MCLGLWFVTGLYVSGAVVCNWVLSSFGARSLYPIAPLLQLLFVFWLVRFLQTREFLVLFSSDEDFSGPHAALVASHMGQRDYTKHVDTGDPRVQ